jgi:OmpA-OmpF porin, OOP family
MSKARTGLAILGLASAMAFTGPALAQETGFYLGGALGQSSFDVDCTGATSCDDKDSSWKIFGGYQFNKHFALEFGYADLGETTASVSVPPFTVNLALEATVWDLVAVGSLPIADRFSILGKIGLYRADTEINGTVPGLGSDSESASNTDLTFGIGARYDFTRNLGVRLEWQRYQDVGGEFFGVTAESDVDVMSAAVIWKF